MTKTNSIKLGVNIDHVATIREARKTSYPNILNAATEAESGGADFITVHLREDRRHVQDEDVPLLIRAIRTHINLEIAATDEMVDFALDTKPHKCCFVPERRQELTTEGGLDAAAYQQKLRKFNESLNGSGVSVSLFIDPDPVQIKAAAEIGVKCIELHTGTYAETKGSAQDQQLVVLQRAANLAMEYGLEVNAGHGLDYLNVKNIIGIPYLKELNIGHSIVAESMFIGIRKAVSKMKQIINAE